MGRGCATALERRGRLTALVHCGWVAGRVYGRWVAASVHRGRMAALACRRRVIARGCRRFVAPALTAAAFTAAALTAAGGCGGAHVPAHTDARRWLSVETAARRATITLVAEHDESHNGFNLDGAAKGALLFSVPSGWTVAVRCVNNSSTRRYACVLQPAPGTAPTHEPARGRKRAPGTAAGELLSLLDVPQPPGGLAGGSQHTFSFVPRMPARYRLAALTGGLEPAGMWVALDIAAGGSRPTVRWVRQPG